MTILNLKKIKKFKILYIGYSKFELKLIDLNRKRGVENVSARKRPDGNIR